MNEQEPREAVTNRYNDVFTENALRDQDGKTIPLTKYSGGPVIGTATLKYNEAEKRLDIAESTITDPEYLKLLSSDLPVSISGEET